MKLHLIRHAHAISRSAEIPDRQRHLSVRGRRRFRQVAATLRRTEIDPDLILAGTAVRTLQTAEILAEALRFNGEVCVATEIDQNFDEPALYQLLQTRQLPSELVIVGHEPDLGRLVAALLGRDRPCRIAKGCALSLQLRLHEGRLHCRFLSLVTGSGSLVTSERKAFERLDEADATGGFDEKDDRPTGTAADSRDRRHPCAKADRCRKRQLCQGCRSRGSRAPAGEGD